MIRFDPPGIGGSPPAGRSPPLPVWLRTPSPCARRARPRAGRRPGRFRGALAQQSA
ncbi:hypothetical protein HBB16_10395 [Pseudonocardia sp. MCCB 268]|nr:hypothetical protein [Pseudonocardia cytotoxica]